MLFRSAVDNAAGPHRNYTVVFIGSEAGVVLKVLAKTSTSSINDSLLLEEIDVFNKAKYAGFCLSLSLSRFLLFNCLFSP